jgi:hypothetical protein
MFLGLALWTGSVHGEIRTVEFPVTLDYPLIRSILKQTVYTGPGGRMLLEDSQGCTRIELWEPEIFSLQSSLAIESRIEFQSSISIGDTCMRLFTWTGYIRILQKVRWDEEGWQLKFQTEDSHIYDESHNRPIIAGSVWDRLKPGLHSSLDQMRIDFSPAMEELKSLLPLFFPSEQKKQVERWIETMARGDVRIEQDSVKSSVHMELETLPSMPEGQAALSQEEIQRLIESWETWDAYFVYQLESLAGQPLEEKERAEISTILLELRHAFVQALTENSISRDFIRHQFVSSWQRTSGVLRKYILRESSSSLLRSLAYFTAADALAIVEGLGPVIGVEVTPEGLVRLASLLSEKGEAPSLEYDDTIDRKLRDVLGLGAPLDDSGPAFDMQELETLDEDPEDPTESPGSSWLHFFLPSAIAADKAPVHASEIREWTPPHRKADLSGYLGRVEQVLQKATEETLSKHPFNEDHRSVFTTLMLATPWQESCWRQFVKNGKKLTYLLSYNRTSVGLMQVNVRVWRGVYKTESLRWNIRYNAGAGAEILDLYMRNYALKHMDSKESANADLLSQVVYAIYNGGPGQLSKFMKRYREGSLYGSDRLFKEKYEYAKHGELEKISICLLGDV